MRKLPYDFHWPNARNAIIKENDQNVNDIKTITNKFEYLFHNDIDIALPIENAVWYVHQLVIM